MHQEATEATLPGLPTGSRFLPELEGLRGLAIALAPSRGAELGLSSRSWLRLGGGDLILVGLFVALAVLLRTVAARGYLPSEIPPEQGWHLAEAALWGGVMLALLVLPLRLRGLVVNRWMTRLGLLSYSIYLVHMPVLHAVFHTMPWLRPGVPRPWGAEVAAGVLAILATLCVSLVTFRVIERPFLRRKDRRRPREPASGGVEAAGAS